MLQRHCSLIALAACLCAGQAMAESPSPSGYAGLPGAAPGECTGAVSPCVQLWGEMDAEERAKLWPFLDEASRTSYWRSMTPAERQDLRAHFSERDREAMRRRYSLDPGEKSAPKRPNLCREDRNLMRQQIMEVHMQYMRMHGTARSGAQPLTPPGGAGVQHTAPTR